MSATIEKQLNESLRDAQLGLYLSAIVPQDETLKALKIAEHLKTANDLYHYWLLDVSVSQEVPTTLVACATASLQQYINSILTNMEPGYHTAQIPSDQVETWRTVMHHYPTWVTHQRLHYFPAVYLDPTLRKTKTDSFQQLENDIDQNQLTTESVQTAVLAYLARLEEVANLTTINGYINGDDFANSTYYFIAKSTIANTYYWRSLDMACRPSVSGVSGAKYDAPEPQAWSDWKRANLPISESAIEHTIRPVVFNNRLYVIWAECIVQDKAAVTKTAQSQNDRINPLFRLNLCYKKYDESWSTPQACLQGYGSHDLLHDLTSSELRKKTRTIAIHEKSGTTDSLFIALYVDGEHYQARSGPPLLVSMSAHIDKDSKTTQELNLTPDDLSKSKASDTSQFALVRNRSSGTEKKLQFKYSTTDKTLSPPKISSRKDTASGTAEFIDFAGSTIELSDDRNRSNGKRAPIRMNITFAKHLIERAESSMDTLLSWGSQHLPEPSLKEGGATEPMDFYGAYGRYFVELFLYLPWLVAHRFKAERQYSEAERWLHYLFNPGRKKVTGMNPDYWNAVPLISSTIPAPGQTTYAIQGPQDPHQIALSHPVHFRKALYLLHVDILLNRGDTAFRTLTPEGLTEAKSWYIRALDLMGPRPDLKQTDPWTTVPLENFSGDTNEGLRTFEQLLGKDKKHQSASSAVVPQICVRPYASPPSVHAIDTPHLRLPFNPVLIARWEKLESRLHNLRHNLDIVGRPLKLPLFAPPIAPGDLLGSNPPRAAEPGIAQHLGSEIPAYRFSALYAHAMSAVDTVIQFGTTLLSYIERREQASYQEFQQHHVWDIANMAVDLQTQALKVDEKNRAALLASKAIVECRRDYYSQRVNEVINPEEVAAAVSHLTGRIAEASAHAAQALGQGLKVAPNIFGLADGGHRLEGVPFAMMAGAQGVAAAAHGAGEALERAAQYRRRHQEWTLAHDQAKLEIEQIDAQLALEAERETASRLLLRQTQASLTQARASYDFLSKRFTNAQLYQWFTNQLSSFYYQVYDSTFSLCQFTELSWRYEMIDYTTQPFFQHQTWNSTYRGLGPGERMKLSLLKMKNAYLLGNERELEIRKTVSLRQLKAKEESKGTPPTSINKPWEDTPGADGTATTDGIKSELVKTGSCEFELTQSLFDNDYPGHCLRRIKSIGISLPAVLSPYEDIRATLTQTGSEVVMPGTDKPPIKSLRANQQIALSTGIDDNGLFTLSFQDERYLPFEYTGAISKWKLSFPNHAAQKSMLESLTDIIVHVSYTARAGGGSQ
ncbi:neuraminidase-like domain-containing protein [Pseudomonas sp. P9_31]|uniref:Tc toxin subunit A-related protein n=1 Tax=Pseudomonas sp. P9_31 TaxID=3043448 RepID=UPI002A36F692|nr:neuraminidase-like domain-containing protein [Pseudomonas sp. P9_31]WPN57299.1 neuraminidase-like domain-containing protein [Pseudomonas sp. P9_31]